MSTCQWIKTEPVEENEADDPSHQFPSVTADNNKQKGDVKSDGQMSSGTKSGKGNAVPKSKMKSIKAKSRKKAGPKCQVKSVEADYSSGEDTELIVTFAGSDKKTDRGDVVTDSINTITHSHTDGDIDAPDTSGIDQNEAGTDATETYDSVTPEDMSAMGMGEHLDVTSSDGQMWGEPSSAMFQVPPGYRSVASFNRRHAPRPHVCDVCFKTFLWKCHLTTHKLIHTGCKPFVCDECNKSFTFSYQLNRHKLIHNNHKPFVCDLCHKAFVYAGDLKKHVLTHTGQKSFMCDVCKKYFTRADHLKKHKLIHAGKKAFACDVCSKSFTVAGDLKRHKLIHSGQKCFECDICDKTFTRKDHLKSHQSVHNG